MLICASTVMLLLLLLVVVVVVVVVLVLMVVVVVVAVVLLVGLGRNAWARTCMCCALYTVHGWETYATYIKHPSFKECQQYHITTHNTNTC